MISLLYLAPLISFLVTFIATPLWIRYLKKLGLVVKDQNKEDKPLIPVSGGLAVLTGMLAGFMVYIFVNLFIYQRQESLLVLLAALITIVLITFIGFLDDLVIPSDKEASTGLKQWQKPLLTLFTAVPLMAVNAGVSKMFVPFVGAVDFGLLYPLLFIPLAVVGASNMVNNLAGMNGLETGMGLIYMGMLGIYAYVQSEFSAAAIATITFGALLAFYYFNKYPAKVFPGDSLTYLLGASLVSIAIVGNIEKAALICSLPFFLEFGLKLRSRLTAKSYGKYVNGKIASYHTKIYSLIHIFTLKPRFTERQITWIFIGIELVFSSLIWVV